MARQTARNLKIRRQRQQLEKQLKKERKQTKKAGAKKA